MFPPQNVPILPTQRKPPDKNKNRKDSITKTGNNPSSAPIDQETAEQDEIRIDPQSTFESSSPTAPNSPEFTFTVLKRFPSSPSNDNRTASSNNKRGRKGERDGMQANQHGDSDSVPTHTPTAGAGYRTLQNAPTNLSQHHLNHLDALAAGLAQAVASSPTEAGAKILKKACLWVIDFARDNAIRLEEGKEAMKIQFGENDKVMYIEKGERERGVPPPATGTEASTYAPRTLAQVAAQKKDAPLSLNQSRLAQQKRALTGLFDIKTNSPARPAPKAGVARDSRLLLRLSPTHELRKCTPFKAASRINSILTKIAPKEVAICAVNPTNTGLALLPSNTCNVEDLIKFQDEIVKEVGAETMDRNVEWVKFVIAGVAVRQGREVFSHNLIKDQLEEQFGIRPVEVKYLMKKDDLAKEMAGTRMIGSMRESFQEEGHNEEMEVEEEEQVNYEYSRTSSLLVSFPATPPKKLRTVHLLGSSRLQCRDYAHKEEVKQCSNCSRFDHQATSCPSKTPICSICSSSSHSTSTHKCEECPENSPEGTCFHPEKCANCHGPHTAHWNGCPARPSSSRIAKTIVGPSPARLQAIRSEQRILRRGRMEAMKKDLEKEKEREKEKTDPPQQRKDRGNSQTSSITESEDSEESKESEEDEEMEDERPNQSQQPTMQTL